MKKYEAINFMCDVVNLLGFSPWRLVSGLVWNKGFPWWQVSVDIKSGSLRKTFMVQCLPWLVDDHDASVTQLWNKLDFDTSGVWGCDFIFYYYFCFDYLDDLWPKWTFKRMHIYGLQCIDPISFLVCGSYTRIQRTHTLFTLYFICFGALSL